MHKCVAGLAMLLAITVPARAQIRAAPDIPLQFPPGMRALNQGWRTHSGDNPAWAQPSFNDNSWPAISLAAPNDCAGWRWYRLRVQLPAQHPPLAMLVTGGGGTYEVYVNGARLRGPVLKSSLHITLPRAQMVPLPDIAGNMVIALRTWIPPTSMFVADRGAWRVRFGPLPAVEEAQGAMLAARLDAILPGVGISLLAFLAGVSFLLLFWWQPEHREYLWLGLYLVGAATGPIAFALAQRGFVPFSFDWFWSDATLYPIMVAQIEFTFSFVGKRVTRGWRLYEALLLAPLVFLEIPAWQGFISRGVMNLEEAVLTIPASVALLILLVIWYRRGYRESSWLILPSLLPMLSVVMVELGIAASYLGWQHFARIGDPLRISVFSLQPYYIADLLFLLAIGIVMFLRFTRVSRAEARAAAEFDAAREIQQRLVPLSLPPVAGCRLQAAYLPAEEVGGDFYQILPQKDGSALIVIGDVSGKGLKAAMTGAVAIGALRTLAAGGLSPAALLTRLNRQILDAQDGGFITGLVVRIAPEGAVILANAGHLPPYRNGEELQLDSSLPLGIAPDTAYSETTLQLRPHDILTFLSDGVVEAQSSTGELFGFDRTAAISTQSAEEIARAAQTHGQQDDITVLTLHFAPAEVLHA